MYSVCTQSGNGVSTPPTHNADRDLKDIVEIKPQFNSHGPEFPAPIQFESDSIHSLCQKTASKNSDIPLVAQMYEGGICDFLWS